MRVPAVLIVLAASGFLTSVLGAAPASAEVVSERPDKVAVVLYQDHAPSSRFVASEDPFDGDPGLAVVSETRTVDLPAGRSRISFRGVADGMAPQTAAIEGVDGGLIERNYDFDLLSPGVLVQKAVDGPARLVRTNPKTGAVSETPVTVRAAPEGIVLQHPDGRAEALGCSGQPERLVFDHAPAGLNATPTLSAEVETARAGRRQIRLTYLATGLRWRADYVARLNPDGRTLDLHGWLTLSNLGGTTFGDAPTQVVAGRLARAGEDVAPQAKPVEAVRSCWPTEITPLAAPADIAPPPLPMMAARFANAEIQEVVVTGSRIATVSNLGDYKLYTLPEPTTVAARQTKQAAFLEQAAVPYQRVAMFQVAHAYGFDPDLEPANMFLRLQNKAAEGLGKPLPGGTVTVLEPKPDGAPSLTGQPNLADTPVGQRAQLRLGESSLVTLQATQGALSYPTRGGKTFERSEVALSLHNAGPKPALVEVRLPQAELTFLGESRSHTRDGAFAVWSVIVPAEGENTLNYRTEAPQ
jgi:hypothetical protein